ncbi:hypothetical protein GH714_041477 [Hevea brasiliensis]|uniref:Uncharacterized protein n=1 Tax=Hevea brasiliensis TaxID=3981 RepID=A0A6A6MZT2_HEVBR|nr:hypothetical protein GH714_041477 [Hevea brasiliensis]
MSSLAAARADNFYYPPEWTPKQIWSFTMKSACCKHEIVIQTDPKNCEYVIISGAQRKNAEFDVEEKRLHFLQMKEEDLQKKKEAEPVLVQLQRVSDARHSDDCALHKALQAQLRSQKKRVAEEEFASSKMGLGIRLLPTTKEDVALQHM